MHIVTTGLLLILMMTMTVCVWFDRRRKRVPSPLSPVSILVPCYNDEATVGATLRSIFASWPETLLDVTVIDDASTDASLARIREVAAVHPLAVVCNPVNQGKSVSLNRAVLGARHERVLCLDADTLLTRPALQDMITRLTHDPRIGAVSCPYKPANRGFLPAMQAIEYSMLRLGQGAGNVTSALALWGGCLMVRRDAFDAVDGFSLHAITEDVDMAFKLNRAGWRVEQSFVFVSTHVPADWKSWFRQKMRWTSGGFQCVFSYPGVWLRNPLQVMFITVYAAMAMLCVLAPANENSLFQVGQDITALCRLNLPLERVWDLTWLQHGTGLMVGLLASLVLSIMSLVYVIPTISRLQDWIRIVLVLPFSLGYFPLYVLVSMLGFLFWFITLRRKPVTARAW